MVRGATEGSTMCTLQPSVVEAGKGLASSSGSVLKELTTINQKWNGAASSESVFGECDRREHEL